MALSNQYEEGAVAVLVIGNATVDEIYAVSALPKPGESVLGTYRSRDVGGKGANVATIMSRCDLPTRLLATVGNDERGEYVQRELIDEPLELDVSVSATKPTDVSIVYCDAHGENAIVTTVDAAHSIDQSRVESSLERVQPDGMLVLQANLSEALTRFAIERARSLGLTIVFNASPFAHWVKDIISDVNIVFINEEESNALTGSCDERSVVSVLEQGPDQVVITLGDKGALLGSVARSENESESPVIIKPVFINMPVCAASVVDTTGAGDTYLAVAMASARLRACPLDSVALNHAARAAAITIGRHGTRRAFPSEGELAEILQA